MAFVIQAAVAILLMLDAQLEGASRATVGVIAVIAYLISVALLRDTLPPTAGFGTLALLPVTWTTLRGRRCELVVAIVGLASIYLVPAALVGGAYDPAGSMRAGVLLRSSPQRWAN